MQCVYSTELAFALTSHVKACTCKQIATAKSATYYQLLTDHEDLQDLDPAGESSDHDAGVKLSRLTTTLYCFAWRIELPKPH